MADTATPAIPELPVEEISATPAASSFSRNLTMAADGANEGILIKTLSAPGLLVDGMTWVLNKAGAGIEDPFLGSDHIARNMTSLYEGYYRLFGYDGSPVPETFSDRAWHKGGEIAGEVGFAAMTMGGSALARQTAELTGEATMAATRAAVAQTGTAASDASHLSFVQRFRVAGSTDNLAYRVKLLAESEGTEAAARYLERAARTGINPDQVGLLRSMGVDSSLIRMADDIARTQVTSGGLTNTFSRVSRTLSYAWNQPAHAAYDLASTLARNTAHVVMHPIQTARAVTGSLTRTATTILGGSAAGVGADLYFNEGGVTEWTADTLLPEGALATAAYAAVDTVRDEEEPGDDLPEAATDPVLAGAPVVNPESRRRAGRIVDAFDGAADVATGLGLTGAMPSTENVGSTLRSLLGWIPGIGGLIWLVEKIGELYNNHIRPLISADADVQGSPERLARLRAQNGGLPGATARVATHAPGDDDVAITALAIQGAHQPRPELNVE